MKGSKSEFLEHSPWLSLRWKQGHSCILRLKNQNIREREESVSAWWRGGGEQRQQVEEARQPGEATGGHRQGIAWAPLMIGG